MKPINIWDFRADQMSPRKPVDMAELLKLKNFSRVPPKEWFASAHKVMRQQGLTAFAAQTQQYVWAAIVAENIVTEEIRKRELILSKKARLDEIARRRQETRRAEMTAREKKIRSQQVRGTAVSRMLGAKAAAQGMTTEEFIISVAESLLKQREANSK